MVAISGYLVGQGELGMSGVEMKQACIKVLCLTVQPAQSKVIAIHLFMISLQPKR